MSQTPAASQRSGPAAVYLNYSARARWIAWALDRTAGPPLGLLADGLAAARRGRSGGARRLLLIRCDHLGDLLMATPALAALRRTLRERAEIEARVELMVSPAGASALRGNPDVDSIILFDAPWYEPHAGREVYPLAACQAAARVWAGRYDALVEMRGDARLMALAAFSGAPRRVGFSGLGLEAVLTDAVRLNAGRSHLVRNFDVLGPLGVPPPRWPGDYRPVLSIDESARLRAEGLLQQAGGGSSPAGSAVVIAPATNRPRHSWGERNFAAVADGLMAAGYRIVLTGRASEAAITARVASLMRGAPIDLTGQTDLAALAAILESARLLVANDGGTVHIAAAAGCPIVAIFGATSPALSFPYEPPPEDRSRSDPFSLNRSFAGPSECERPCFLSNCPGEHGYGAVRPDEVLAACLSILEAPLLMGRSRR